MRWADYAVVFFGFACSVLRSAFGETEGTLIIKSRSSVFNAGEKKAIFCEGTGVTEPIEWYTPSGDKVPHGSSLNKRIYSEPKTVQDKILVPLFIHSVKVEDSGNWTCKAGDLSQTIEFNVGVKVVIPMRTQTVLVDEGNRATLYCEAKGYPEPSVQWYFDNTPISDLETPNKYIISRKEDNYTLLIKNVQHYDAGDYVCKVTQKVLSHYTDKTINLVVHHKPLIFNPEKNEVRQPEGKRLEVVEEVFAVVGDTKLITCNAIAMPPPTFHWYKMIDGYQDDIKQTDLIETSEDKLSSTYTLRMNSESDAGTYRCIARNKKGQAIVDFDVTPGKKPDPPTEIKVVSRNSSHITFNVTCNCTLKAKDDIEEMDPSDLPVDGYVFHVIKHDENYQAQDWTQEGNSTEFDIENVNVTLFTFGPLPKESLFHVRVRSRNAAGYSDWLEMAGTCETSSAVRLAATSVAVILALLIF